MQAFENYEQQSGPEYFSLLTHCIAWSVIKNQDCRRKSTTKQLLKKYDFLKALKNIFFEKSIFWCLLHVFNTSSGFIKISHMIGFFFNTYYTTYLIIQGFCIYCKIPQNLYPFLGILQHLLEVIAIMHII